MREIGLADVEREADRQVLRLKQWGVEPGQSIGWLGLNSLEGLGLLYACGHVGARFVPLNWRLAAPELADIAVHAGLQRLLHDPALATLAQDIRNLISLPLPVAEGHREGDWMVVYTSGTTGRPKGAIHTVEGMRANMRAAIEAQGLTSQTKALAVLPMFHVGGLCIQVLPTLAAGGRVLLHERFDPLAWLRDVAQWRPTTSLLVPATMQALLDHPHWQGADLKSLQFINCGSSVVPRAHLDGFFDAGVPVTQVYGATETGPVSIVLPLDEAPIARGKVGRPAKEVQVRLMTPQGRPVVDPEVGEIWLRAPNLMRGYHREPDSAAFTDGWFRTGDLAWRDANGLYEVVGRCKDMIISGGENIYPAEIENCVLGLADLKECAVVSQPDRKWGEIPVLVVVTHSGQPLDEAALRQRLDTQLARFKHPKRWVQLHALPRTALGKVQKERLSDQISAP
mgnify:FL=1